MSEKSEITRDEAHRLFQARRLAWLANDTDAYLDLWHDEMVIELPSRSEPLRGKAAYRELIEATRRSLKPVSWDYHALAVEGDRVLAEWTISGESIAQGQLIRWTGMSICTIRDGLIREWREYWDPATLS